jgi:hypothetical protein
METAMSSRIRKVLIAGIAALTVSYAAVAVVPASVSALGLDRSAPVTFLVPIGRPAHAGILDQMGKVTWVALYDRATNVTQVSVRGLSARPAAVQITQPGDMRAQW